MSVNGREEAGRREEGEGDARLRSTSMMSGAGEGWRNEMIDLALREYGQNDYEAK